MKTYTLRDVRHHSGAFRERLKSWYRLRLLDAKAQGTGHPRRFTFPDLVEARIVAILDGLGLQTDAIWCVLARWRIVTTRGAYRVPRYAFSRRNMLRAERQRFIMEIAGEIRDRDGTDLRAERAAQDYFDKVCRLLDPATRGDLAFRLRVLPPPLISDPAAEMPDLENLTPALAASHCMLPRVVFDVLEPWKIQLSSADIQRLRGLRPDADSTVLHISLPPVDRAAIVVDLRAEFEALEAATGDRWPVQNAEARKVS
jgi:hypothetical protein